MHFDMIEGDVGVDVDLILEDEQGTLPLQGSDRIDYIWWFEDENPARRFGNVTVVDVDTGHVRHTTVSGDLNDNGVLMIQAQLLRGTNVFTTHPQEYQIGPLGT